MSSASILLETSKAKTTSTPSRLIVSNFIPIFGFTNAMAKHTNAKLRLMSFKTDLNKDLSGLSLLNSATLAKAFWRRFFIHKLMIKKRTTTGMINSKRK